MGSGRIGKSPRRDGAIYAVILGLVPRTYRAAWERFVRRTRACNPLKLLAWQLAGPWVLGTRPRMTVGGILIALHVGSRRPSPPRPNSRPENIGSRKGLAQPKVAGFWCEVRWTFQLRAPSQRLPGIWPAPSRSPNIRDLSRYNLRLDRNALDKDHSARRVEPLQRAATLAHQFDA
jgi:hypothetical protein